MHEAKKSVRRQQLIYQRPCMMQNRNVAWPDLPSTWSWSFCDDDLPPVLCHHCVSVWSGRSTTLIHLFSVQICVAAPSSTLFSFVSLRFLSWGEECMCSGHGGRDTLRLGLSRQFSDFPNHSVLISCSIFPPFSYPAHSALLPSHASHLLGGSQSHGICVDMYHLTPFVEVSPGRGLH